MKYLLVHLSDLHFSEDGLQFLNIKQNKLLETINIYKNDNHAIIFVISGDIANTGKIEEYELALDFFENLKKELGIEEVSFVVSPGNHDCDFSNQNEEDIKYRNMVIDGLNHGEKHDLSEFERKYNLQENYHIFKNELNNQNIINERPLFDHYAYDTDGYKLSFLSCNSSYFSRKREQQGKLIIDSEDIDNNLLINENSIQISLFHHPFQWISRKANFQKIIEDKSDIIFTGHEHQAEIRIKNVYEDIDHVHIIGGEFHHKDRTAKSSFNILILDTETTKFSVHQYNLEKGEYISNEFYEGILKEKVRDNKIVKLREDYYDDFINTSDIFLRDGVRKFDVYVDFRLKSNLDDFISNDKMDIEGEKVFYLDESDIFDTNGYIHIIGDEGSGKSTLLSEIYRNFFQAEKVPILLKGVNFYGDTDEETIITKIEAEFKKQYKESTTKFKKLNNETESKIILLIDDIDNAYNGIVRPTINVLFKLKKLFKKVIITSSKEFSIEALEDKNYQKNGIVFFKSYQILPFNNLQKYKLVEKGYTHGLISNMDEINNVEIERNMFQIYEKANSIINNKFMPSTPKFILIFFKAIDDVGLGNLISDSKAYFYRYVIISNLHKVAKISKQPQDFIETLLREIAYELYIKKTNQIDRRSFDEFLKYLIKRYGYEERSFYKDIEIIIKCLIDTDFLVYNASYYMFSYKFIYYYFTAEYFSKNIRNHKKDIEKIIYEINKKDNANIVLFFTLLGDTSIIIDNLIEQTNLLYSENDVILLEKDVKVFNFEKVIEEVSVNKLVESQEITREELIMDRDSAESYENVDMDDYDNLKEFETLAVLSKTLKIIEINGQLMKNQANSLQYQEKYLFTISTMNLCLRMLKYIINNLNSILDNPNELDFTEVNDENTKEQFESLLKMLTFNVVHMMILYTAKMIGNNKMHKIFKDIEGDNPAVAYKLMYLVIELEYNNNFDAQFIYDLIHEYENNKTVNNFVIKIINYYVEIVGVDPKQFKLLLEKLQVPSIKKVKLLQHNNQIVADNKLDKITESETELVSKCDF